MLNKLKSLVAMTTVVASLPAAGAGCYYRATLGDERIDLLGAIHLRQAEPEFDPAPYFDGVRTLALETDPDDRSGVLGLLWDNFSLRASENGLSEEQNRQLVRVLGRQDLPEGLARRTKPLVLAGIIALKELQAKGYESVFGPEDKLGALARARALPVVGLESNDERIRALKSVGRHDEIRLLAEVVDAVENGELVREFSRLHRMWESSDCGGFERSADALRSSAVGGALLGNQPLGRNALLVDRMRSLAHERKNVLVALGVLHLYGEYGVLAHLRKLGYQVERLHATP